MVKKASNIWLASLTPVGNKKGAWVWIPHEVLKKLGLAPGSKVVLVLNKSELKIIPAMKVESLAR
ncbi:MAG: AbrB/MazE/SpoVT family DNA-binding domain-containing protein [Nitrososphaerota archaeon]